MTERLWKQAESVITQIHKSEGCRQFTIDTELKGGSKEQKRVEAYVRGVHGLKMGRSAIEKEVTRV
jgi:hypothetical protein